ncbi:MAG: endonuclease/exonuclease/phosphatase family protein [Myxococcota bacterium]
MLLLLLSLVAGVVWMAGGVQSPHRFEAPILDLGNSRPVVASSTITVVVWNVAWGYGPGSEGSGRRKDAAHFETSLERMGALLAEKDADIVLLQEVDFGATRSHHVDQAERLARAAGLRYVAPAVSWVANWVPFPYWPPRDHFGRMRSGGAVLSRFPIELNEVSLLEKPEGNPFWYNLFYLFRYVQATKLRVLGAPFRVYNTHLEAFDLDNRKAQARALSTIIGDGPENLVLVGGDLNSVPPEAAQRADFPDEPETDFSEDDTVALLRATAKLSDAFTQTSSAGPEEASFTFPAESPNRKLDHLFLSPEFRVVSAEVAREAGSLSDHLPLVVRIAPAQ